jgi:hypothetical protein
MAIINLLSGYDSALPASAKRFAETSFYSKSIKNSKAITDVSAQA